MNSKDTETPTSVEYTDCAQLLDLIAQCADYYWREDVNGCCHNLRSHPSFNRDPLGQRHAGVTIADAGLVPVADEGIEARYLAARKSRNAFQNIIFTLDSGTNRFHFSISGTPVKSATGNFEGYHCVAIDITDQRETESVLKRFRIAMDMSMDMIYLVDRETLRFIDVNKTACDAVGRSFEEMLKTGPSELLGIPEDELVERYDRLITEGSSSRMERLVELASAGKTHIEVYSRATLLDGRWTIVGMSRDITARKHAEEQLRQSEARFKSLTQLSSDFYWEQNTRFRFTQYEGRIIGDSNRRAAAALIGKHLWDIPGLEPDGTSWQHVRVVLSKKKTFKDFEFSFTNDVGAKYHFSLSGEAIFDDDGKFTGYRGIARDISEKKRISEHIKYLATHDSLTGLPNRVMFQQMLSEYIKRAERYPGDAFAVLFIDLDRFKSINDSFGHQVGDELLQHVANRLRKQLRNSDLIARLGGDEFVVLLHRLSDKDQIKVISDKILALFDKPVLVDCHECDISVSIGISIYGEDADTANSLMKHADAAMYVAKDEGRNNAQLYAQEIHELIQERVELERCLRGALERNELDVHYQAKVDIDSSRIMGVEALVRWHSPELGDVSPARFIPVAEDTGMIIRIGEWVMLNACRQVMQWQNEGMEPIGLSVNLSARQFNDPDLADKVSRVLDDTGIPAGQLEFEITESTMMRNPRRTAALMSRIRRLGVGFALDDFGTGYSSLGQLKTYSLDTLKIDRSFIAELENSTSSQAICQAIISMGTTLGMSVVAEGVENKRQLTVLRTSGCHLIQGFYFHRPQPASDFYDFYTSYMA